MGEDLHMRNPRRMDGGAWGGGHGGEVGVGRMAWGGGDGGGGHGEEDMGRRTWGGGHGGGR